MKDGSSVKLCSLLTVPAESPDVKDSVFLLQHSNLILKVNVEVTWKVLLQNNYDDECETTYDVEELKSEGKYPLVCIKIPARVQAPRG